MYTLEPVIVLNWFNIPNRAANILENICGVAASIVHSIVGEVRITLYSKIICKSIITQERFTM